MKVRAPETRGKFLPVIAAASVAVLATAALFLLEFTPPRDARATDPGMITSAAASRAGATVLPTDPNTVGRVRGEDAP
ncbi:MULTISPECIES: hypothetical protein [Bradyrhizobium]|uniref:hypothetical protein n=1 Tax=Bradyrhizobium elkanii TaxID=29448 RepID=UPI0004290AE7|nr:hypothetical protein [Bradyrhizobium elkanii]